MLCRPRKQLTCLIIGCLLLGQVHLHTALEKSLPDFVLKRVDKTEIIEYPNMRKTRLGIVDHVFKYFQPKTTNKGTFGLFLFIHLY